MEHKELNYTPEQASSLRLDKQNPILLRTKASNMYGTDNPVYSIKSVDLYFIFGISEGL